MNQYLNTAGRFLCLTAQPSAGWLGESKTGTEFIELLCEVIEDCPQKGQFISWYGYLSEKAFDWTISALTKACGFSGDLDALSAGRETLADKQVVIVAEFEDFEGKPRLKAKRLNAPGGQREPMAKEKVGAFVAKWGGRAKAIAKDTRAQIEAGGESVPLVTVAKPKPTDAQLANQEPKLTDEVPF